MGRKKKNDPVFFDAGKRWKKVKRGGLGIVFLSVFTICICIYSYLISPFDAPNRLSEDTVDQAIEEINADIRPVYNKGTFLTIADVYGTRYIKRFGEDGKKVLLTFDDGPDPQYTEKILQILEEENVHATFFVLGSQVYKYPEIGDKILAQGSDMGMHTFSHFENSEDKKLLSTEFIKELNFAEKIFMHQYHYKPMLFRIPYVGVEETLSYNSLQYIGEAYKRGLTISAPTVDSQDWQKGYDAKKIVELATTADVQTIVILMHDAGGNRESTIQALPEIISFYRERGYTFMTVSQLAKENNLPYQSPLTLSDSIMSAVIFYLYDIYKKTPSILQKGFTIGFVVVLVHTMLILLLALIQKIKIHAHGRKKIKPRLFNELVSVIIPMHNEEQSIRAAMRSILRSSYKNFELLVIDDGSTDHSYERALEIAHDPRVKVFHKSKSGKHRALNYGIMHSKGRVLVCVDADTRLTTSALKNIVQLFTDKRVGAVAGNIKIGNKRNFLTHMQSLEYTVGQSIEKRVNELFGVVSIVPGAFGAWRKSALQKSGRFTNETHAEDFDLTLRIIKSGYQARYCENAIAHTEAPHSLAQLITQRIRWNFGNLQVFFKHKDMLFNKKYGIFGLFLFPRFVIVQVPAILLTPFVDLIIVINLLFGDRILTMTFFLMYLLLQLCVVLIAHVFAKHRDRSIAQFMFLRFPYTQIMYAVLIAAVLQALKGEIMAWTKLYHSGRFSKKVRKSPVTVQINIANKQILKK